MRNHRSAPSLLLALASACSQRAASLPAPAPPVASDAAPQGPGPLRLRALFEGADGLLGRAVVVDLYESMNDPEDAGSLEPGARRVHYAAPANLYVRFAPGAPEGAQQGPFRIHGTLERRAPDGGGFFWYVLHVRAAAPLRLPAAERIGRCELLVREGPRWDGRMVTCEGVAWSGMEWSTIDGAWLAYARYAVRANSAADAGMPDLRDPRNAWLAPASALGVAMRGERPEYPMRVTGFVDARPSGRYGHRGYYRAQLTATRIEYLAPPRPHRSGLLRALDAGRGP